jgi:hypothetical protein
MSLNTLVEQAWEEFSGHKYRADIVRRIIKRLEENHYENPDSRVHLTWDDTLWGPDHAKKEEKEREVISLATRFLEKNTNCICDK